MVSQTFFHLAAYRGSVGAGLTNVDIAAVNDGVLTLTNNHFLVPQEAQLLFAAGFGVNMTRLLLNTPSLRYVGLPSIWPINNVVTVPSPFNLFKGGDFPLKLPKADEIAIQASQNDAGAQQMAALVAFGFNPPAAPSGTRYRLRATATITGVVGAWANGSLTMDTTLPAGIYALVGMQVMAANVLGARLIFPGASFRPGVIPVAADQNITQSIFVDGTLGVFGQFENVNLPNLEIFLGSGANAAQEIFLDVVRMGNVN